MCDARADRPEWHVRSVELKRFCARDERVAARNRRLGARLQYGCLGPLSEGRPCRLSARSAVAIVYILMRYLLLREARLALPLDDKGRKTAIQVGTANIILPLLRPS